MALINCPECGQEVSNQAPACIHCGYPLNEEIPLENKSNLIPTKVAKTKLALAKKQKVIVSVCFVAVVVIAYLGLFHLGTEEKYTYDLIIENAGDFKNPKGIEVISGTAGWSDEDEEPYAFVCITSTNGYGAERAGYYLFGLDYVYDVSDDSGSVTFCKRDKLNVGTINRRLALYWVFH